MTTTRKVYEMHREWAQGAHDYTVVATVSVEDLDGVTTNHALPHVAYHNAEGFDYGYEGAGPGDLALSILADFFGEVLTPDVDAGDSYAGERSLAVSLHEAMATRFIAPMDPVEGGTITTGEITDWLRAAIRVAEQTRPSAP